MFNVRNGKRPVNDWTKLPPEVLRLVATHYLAYNPHAVTPNSWLHGEFYYQRAIYDALRDAHGAQRLMWVCRRWQRALADLDIWSIACKALDRMDYMRPSPIDFFAQGGANAVLPLRIVHNYDRFRLLCQTCCIICRINRPRSHEGVGSVKGRWWSHEMGFISVCKFHRSGNTAFCGVCLKEYALASRGDHSMMARVPESLFPNEDFDTWPRVGATCHHCRRQALLKCARAYTSPTVNLIQFIGGESLECDDYEARSTVDAFLEMAEGGVNEVLSVLLERHWLRANTPLNNLLAETVASVRLVKDQLRELEGPGYESEDDMLSDDESSYDMLQSHEESGVRAVAMSAWARSRIMDGNWVSPHDLWLAERGQLGSTSTWDPSIISAAVIPRPEGKADDIRSPDPATSAPIPSQWFLDIITRCFRATLHDILYEPLCNIAEFLENEAHLNNQDPFFRLPNTTLDEVLAHLRHERFWYVDKGHGPRLPHALPLIPMDTRNMPPMTHNMLMQMWQEACAPFLVCKCGICTRAVLREQAAAATLLREVAGEEPQVPPAPTPVVKSEESPRQIVLEETDAMEDDEPLNDDEIPTSATSPRSDTSVPTSISRKRSSAELDDIPTDTPYPPQSTPPSDSPRKRQRTGSRADDHDDDSAMSSEPESPSLSDSHTISDSPERIPSETGRSSSSSSDSSSLRSVPSGEPLTTLGTHSISHVTESVKSSPTKFQVQIHGHDDDEDIYGEEHVVRYMT